MKPASLKGLSEVEGNFIVLHFDSRLKIRGRLGLEQHLENSARVFESLSVLNVSELNSLLRLKLRS